MMVCLSSGASLESFFVSKYLLRADISADHWQMLVTASGCDLNLKIVELLPGIFRVNRFEHQRPARGYINGNKVISTN